MRGASHRVSFDDNAACAIVFGQHHLNLARIEQKIPVSIVTRGNEVLIQGDRDADVHAAAAVLEALHAKAQRGTVIDRAEVDAALRMAGAGERPAAQHVQIRTEGRPVSPRSLNQAAYVRALETLELVFATGPAGTGKTYLAVAQGVSFLKQRRVERLILSRPAVEAGERLGFLPGDLKEKVDPYLRPLYDALQDMLTEGRLATRMENGQIEIAPLAYMRGRTLSNAFVILDEAQNTSPAQMKMFLTRLGENSRMVVTGDPSQTDLPPGTPSGLSDALARLTGIEGIGMVTFDRGDIVRHPLVTEIIEAYERGDKAAATPEPETRRRPNRAAST
ncbi:PhoH family protein [Marinimicrococcus flavescens]|uniref:PhoH-like protein n=1 Tax=Marinimicrococcus flavescens TaxID=3031815 RepID=A0AAP3V221_9PROT|nr:PhoH family protein [Marinimicrococcus flavescens]